MVKLLSIVDVKLDCCALYITLLSKSNLCSSSKMQNYLPSQSPRNLLATHKTAKQHPKSHSSIQINQSNQVKSNSNRTSLSHPFQTFSRHAVAQLANASTPMALKPFIFDLTKRQRCRVAPTSKVSAARRLNSPVRKWSGLGRKCLEELMSDDF